MRTTTKTNDLYPAVDVDIKTLEAKKENIVLKNTASLNSIQPKVDFNLQDVLTPSTLKKENGSIDAEKLINEYNKNVQSPAIGSSKVVLFRDRWYLEPGEVLLGARNRIPEMEGFVGDKYLYRNFNKLTDTTEIDNTVHKITDSFYGWHGSYVLNVPIGQYAVGMSGNVPHLYDAGPHVIHDPNFSFDPKKGFVDKSSTYINHKNIHIIRVPLGQLAKIWVNNIPYILPHQSEPYVFNDPLFRIQAHEGNHFVNASENVIQHGTISIIRVPVGKIAKVWSNNTPYLLEAREEPYIFNDPLFKLQMNGPEPFFNAADNVIDHGSIHMLRVPIGKVAKVWINNNPVLLEAREQSYVFNDPIFRLDRNNEREPFFDATNNVISHGSKHIVRVPSGKIAKVWVNNESLLLEARTEPYIYHGPLFRIDMNGEKPFFDSTDKLIIHGPIKRAIPHSGEVLITYNSGKLEVMEPRIDNTPITLDSPTHEVAGFLNIGVRNLVFPSDQTKAKRSAETGHSVKDNDEVNLEIFTTRDSVLVGVKLFVSFKITDANKALLQLIDNESILEHIENVARIDMGKAIKDCTWQEFLSFYQNKPEKERSVYEKQMEQLGNVETPLQHFQDQVKNALSKDLKEFGIELVRLNIETPKLMDKELAKKMSEQALNTAATTAKEAIMEQNYRIAKREAEQKAETKRIEQDQMNAAKISQAEAELNSAKLSAQAKTISAEGEKQSIVLRAEGEKQSAVLRAEGENEASTLRGKQFDTNPKLFELEKMKYQSNVFAEAISKIPVLPQSFFGANGIYGSPLTFFSQGQSQESRSIMQEQTNIRALNVEQQKETATKKM